MAEAISVLRSLRMPSMNAVIVMNQVGNEGRGLGLLDGGATHALRPWKNREEWNEAEIVEVHLTDGSSTKMRSKPGTLTLLAEKGHAGNLADGGHDGSGLCGDVDEREVLGVVPGQSGGGHHGVWVPNGRGKCGFADD